MAEQFCKLSNVAETLGISEDQVRKLVDSGELEAISVHAPGASRQCIRVSETAIKSFIACRAIAKPKPAEKRRMVKRSKTQGKWV